MWVRRSSTLHHVQLLTDQCLLTNCQEPRDLSLQDSHPGLPHTLARTHARTHAGETTRAHQWRLLRGGRLLIMAGTERMEWHQTHGNHVFDVLDAILLQPIPRARSPQLRCHQPPVARRHTCTQTGKHMHACRLAYTHIQ